MNLQAKTFVFTLLLALIAVSFGAPLSSDSTCQKAAIPKKGNGVRICGARGTLGFALKETSKKYRTNAFTGGVGGLVKGEAGKVKPIDFYKWSTGKQIVAYGKKENLARTRVEADHLLEAQYIKHAMKELMFEGNGYYRFCEQFRTLVANDKPNRKKKGPNLQGLLDIINGPDNLMFLDTELNNLKGVYTDKVIDNALLPEAELKMPAWPAFKGSKVDNMKERVAGLARYHSEIYQKQMKVAENIYDYVSARYSNKDSNSNIVAKEDFLLRVWKDNTLLDNTAQAQAQAPNWAPKMEYFKPDPNYAANPPPNINDFCKRGEGISSRCTGPTPLSVKPLVDWNCEDWDNDSQEQGNDEILTIDPPPEASVQVPVVKITAAMVAGFVIKDLWSDQASIQHTGDVVTSSVDFDALASSDQSTSLDPSSTTLTSLQTPLSTSTTPPASSSSTAAPTSSTSAQQVLPPPPPPSSTSGNPIPPSPVFSVSLVHSLLPPLPPAATPAPP